MSEGYWFTVVGLICFFEGLPYLAMPERWKRLTLTIIATESRLLRVFGGILMVLGLLLVYWGRNHGG